MTHPSSIRQIEVAEVLHAFTSKVQDWHDAAALVSAAAEALDSLLGAGAAVIRPREGDAVIAIGADDGHAVPVLTPTGLWGTIESDLSAATPAQHALVTSVIAGQLGVALHTAQLTREQAASSRETERRLREALTLANLSQGFVRGKELTRVLQRIVDGTTELMNCEISTVLLRTPGATALEVVAANQGTATAVIGDLIPLDRSLAGWVVQTGRPRICMDPSTEPLAYRPSGDRAGIRNHLIVPLRGEDERIGVLTVSNRKAPGPFDTRDIELLSELAKHAEAAIESSRVLEALRRKVAESAALSEVGRAVTGTLALHDVLTLVVREAEALIGGQCASVALRTDTPDILRVEAATGILRQEEGKLSPIGESFSGWVVRHGRTEITDCISDDPRTRPHTERFGPAVAVPLTVGEVTRGALLVVRGEHEASIDQNDVESLEHLAAYAAVAIENAGLHTQAARALAKAQERVALLSALLETGNRFRVAVDLPGLLHEIAETIQHVLGWDHVVIMQNNPADDTTRPAATAGFDAETAEQILNDTPTPLEGVRILLQDRFRISNSYFISHQHIDFAREHAHIITNAPQRQTAPGEWNPEDNFIVPIVLGGDVLGYISPDTPRSGQVPSLEDVQALELFANQTAIAIENARLYEAEKRTATALRRRVDLLSSLLETGNQFRLEMLETCMLLETICRAVQELGWQFVVISMRDYEAGVSRAAAAVGYPPEQRDEILAMPPTPLKGLESRLREEYRISNSYYITHQHYDEFADATTILTPEASRQNDAGDWHPYDILLVPIELRGKLLGFISPDAPVNGCRPTITDIQELELFANQAAIAIDNLQLYQAQKETANALRLQQSELERAYHDLSESQEQLLVSEKMAALGRITAGIAHEINSPLGGILNGLEVVRGYAEEYLASIADAEVTAEDHRAIATDMLETLSLTEGATRKVAQFVRSIKAQTRAGEPSTQTPFDPKTEVESTVLLLYHHMRELSITLEMQLENGLILTGDPGKFGLVVQNLVTNAIDAYEDQPGAVLVRLHGDGADVVLEVEDHGCGIADEIRGRIFDYLFTTKEIGRGTGLGLSMVHSIVTSHFRGDISLRSRVGGGTRFTLRFPTSAEPLQEPS
jgi:signal transduction histidine kinase